LDSKTGINGGREKEKAALLQERVETQNQALYKSVEDGIHEKCQNTQLVDQRRNPD